jgi:hypothetical protein
MNPDVSFPLRLERSSLFSFLVGFYPSRNLASVKSYALALKGGHFSNSKGITKKITVNHSICYNHFTDQRNAPHPTTEFFHAKSGPGISIRIKMW